ncbi:MAG: hypothetical protein SFV32_07695 [Opitutaceae bacterium]|nr:hypothetical protein [Opitutaceae bacterium]
MPLVLRVAPLLTLLAATLWLVSPYLSSNLVGSGDAVWYRHQVQDAIAQARAGQFPLWVGQTEAAYNGAIHPLRSAPALLHSAAVLDWVTGQTRSAGWILNHLIAGFVLVAATSCWLALRTAGLGGRWMRTALSWLFVTCPGVLGLAAAQDLLMSVTALPWLPWVFVGALSIRIGGWRAPSVLGLALGGLWWSHAPVALWTCLSLVVLIIVDWLASAGWRSELPKAIGKIGLAASVFLVAASYPLVSVLSLRNPGESLVPAMIQVSDLLREINNVFPAIVIPVDPDQPRLAVMQPGYAILGLLAACIAVGVLSPRRFPAAAATGAAGFALLVFILPIPKLTPLLWESLPTFWTAMTNLWPMQRVVPLLGALAVAGVGCLLARERVRPQWFKVAFSALAIWAGSQGLAVRELARKSTADPQATALVGHPENINVSAYCYQQLPRRPSTFIHGVTDAEMELRWLPKGSEPTTAKAWVERLAVDPWEFLDLRRTENPGLFRSARAWRLEPGRKYLLNFDFLKQPSGVLRLTGRAMQRVYPLPSAGDAHGFGAGEGQERSLTVWTTQAEGDDVWLEFIPQDPATFDLTAFARCRLLPIRREALPVQLQSLVPLRLELRDWPGGAIETPRMAVPGWQARGDDRWLPVSRSPEGRVQIDVPAGVTTVAVIFQPSLLMRVAFGCGVACLSAFLFLAPFPFADVSHREDSGELNPALR